MSYNGAIIMIKPTVSIVCPTYNEAGIAAKVLAKLYLLVSRRIPRFEIVVLDDGSGDTNLKELSAYAKGKRKIRVISQTPNQGIAISVRRLYTLVRYEWTIFFSLDAEWDPMDVVRFYERFSMGDCDMVLGVRKEKHYSPGRKFVSWLYNTIVFSLFGVKTSDAGSIKAMNTNIVQKVPIVSIGVFDEAERIVRASRMGYRIASIAVNHLPTRKSARMIPRPALILQAAGDLIRVWFSIHFWE